MMNVYRGNRPKAAERLLASVLRDTPLSPKQPPKASASKRIDGHYQHCTYALQALLGADVLAVCGREDGEYEQAAAGSAV